MSRPLRILQISPRIPWPPAHGAAIGIYYITKSVAARGHDITFIAFTQHVTHNPIVGRIHESTRRDASAAHASAAHASGIEPIDALTGDMPAFCRVEVVPHDTRNKAWAALWNLFSKKPYTVSKYACDAMTERIDELCGETRFDVVHVDHVHLSMYGEYAQQTYGIPYVLREHNFETTIYRRLAERTRLPLLGLYLRLQSARLYRHEADALRHPDLVAAITPEDAADIRRTGAEHVQVIPAGVDTVQIQPFSHPTDPAHVVIVGPLVWRPNIDAALWFATEIWPRVRTARPDACCTVAGMDPPKELLRHASGDLRFPGFVEDYEALLASATVMAVPLRIGGGMRVKLLEFFAYGKAVVSTGIGAEGNAAQDGVHFLRADSAADFAAALITLLQDAERRRALGAAGRALVEQHYSWEHIGGLFENAYLDAITRQSGVPVS
ncbi:MAG: glycosyltransferase [Bacteroidetes bacterium]|nr:glycosyltransferase [Bacteroidota bacterium]